MNVIELRCTSCLAPIDPSLGPVQRCAYCGTPLTIGGAPAGKLRAGAPVRGGAFLEDAGPNKIMVIKVIRDHTKLGLKEAKDITESAPCVVGEHLDGAASERLRRDLREAGARVR